MEKTFTAVATGKARLKGRAFYRIKDNFFNFWFRYVYPFQDYLERGDTAVVADYLSRDFNSYLGLVFEDVAREFLVRHSSDPVKIGKWWHKDKEIDLVVLNETKRESVFFEVKWRELERRDCERILEVLKEKTGYVDWHKKERIERYGLIAKRINNKTEFKDKGYLVYDLEDLEALMNRLSS